VTLGSSPLTLGRLNAPLSGKRRTVIPYTRTVAARVVQWSRSGYKSGVCTGNGRTPAPSGTTLDLPKPQSADAPTVTLRLDNSYVGDRRRGDARPDVRMDA